MTNQSKLKESLENFTPPLPPGPDEVAAQAANLVGDVHNMVLERPLSFVQRWTGKVGGWLRSRSKGNL